MLPDGLLRILLVVRHAWPESSRSRQGEPILTLAEMSGDDRAWLLDYVAPIIFPDEERLFLLINEEHRATFKDEFWSRRERAGLPPPLGPGYRRRYEEIRRIVDASYEGWRQDAGRMVIAHGEPSSIENVSEKGCGDLFRNLEIWTYVDPGTSGFSFRHELFYRLAPGAPRKVWRYGDSDSDLLQPGSCRKSLTDLQRWECPPPRDISIKEDHCAPACAEGCRVILIWNEIKARHGSALGGRIAQSRVLAPPEVPREDLDSLAARFPEIGSVGARTIALESGDSGSSPTGAVDNETRPMTRPWSSEQIREAILALPRKYRDWLDLAGPLVSTEELVEFLRLRPGERDEYIRRFWKHHAHASSRWSSRSWGIGGGIFEAALVHSPGRFLLPG